MAESIGNQALRMANTVTRIQNSSTLRENAALRGQRMIAEKQKETLTGAWADRLIQDPEAVKTMPAELPPGVRAGAEILATKQKLQLGNLNAQTFNNELKTFKIDIDGARAALTTGDRSLYLEPVLKAMGRAHDGRSDYRFEGNNQWSFLNNTTGKRQTIEEPNQKQLSDYLSAVGDIKTHSARKITDHNRRTSKNTKLIQSGGFDYYGKDGTAFEGASAAVFPGYEAKDGSSKNLIMVTYKDGTQRTLDNPEEIKQFYRDTESPEAEEYKEKRAKAKDDSAKRNAEWMVVNGERIQRSEVYRKIAMLSKQVIASREKNTALPADSVDAELNALIGNDIPKTQLAVGSVLERAKKIKEGETGYKEAQALIEYIKAVGLGGGTPTVKAGTDDFDKDAAIKQWTAKQKVQTGMKVN